MTIKMITDVHQLIAKTDKDDDDKEDDDKKNDDKKDIDCSSINNRNKEWIE